MVATIDSYDAFKAATSQDKLVIIDFWATCKVISPVFEKLESSFPNIGFLKCDVDAQEEVAAEVGIKAMPTFVLFKNGAKVGTVVGADPNKLKAALELHSESA
ncbi:thioredoxin [Rhodotorula toruloides]|uniref:Thioredoxin n=1 Tax=Rhodotorula toruloides TaxID=5286 RepID=A0A511KC47_RHOTO|nr:thioredoxin [Rhodotorula toruloides]